MASLPSFRYELAGTRERPLVGAALQHGQGVATGELVSVSLRAGRARPLGSAALQHGRGVESSSASRYELAGRGCSAVLRCSMVGAWRARRRLATSWSSAAARPCCVAAWRGMASWPGTAARRSHSTGCCVTACSGAASLPVWLLQSGATNSDSQACRRADASVGATRERALLLQLTRPLWMCYGKHGETWGWSNGLVNSTRGSNGPNHDESTAGKAADPFPVSSVLSGLHLAVAKTKPVVG